jgi:hypothetical protein
MFDILSTILWVGLGVGVLALAFVEYALTSKKRAIKA